MLGERRKTEFIIIEHRMLKSAKIIRVAIDQESIQAKEELQTAVYQHFQQLFQLVCVAG